MNLTNRPILQKQPPIKDRAYMEKVATLPCIACEAKPVEVHHCRDKPDHDERHIYERIPGGAMKSGDRDTLPLCPACHDMFHRDRATFHHLHGRDYRLLPLVRSLVDG